MPTKSSRSAPEKELIRSIKELTGSVDSINSMWTHFMRGIFYGLGILIAFALVVPILIALLGYIEWVPLLGDLVTQIIERIQETPFTN